ncbi:MAG: hypothetical protein WBG11_06075 [Methylocella sp.]
MREGAQTWMDAMCDSNSKKMIYDISVDEWKAAFAPTVQEFPATRFVIVGDGPLVRLAFGHLGAPIDEQGGRDTPVFTVAISMSPTLALELRQVLERVIQVHATQTNE